MARWSLSTNLPLRGRAHLRFAPGAQASRPRARRRRAPSARHWIAVLVPPACAPEARAPLISVPGRDARAFPCACAPSSPRPPSPTRGEGGFWVSRSPKQEKERRGLPTNPPLRGRAHLRFAPGARASRPRARRRRAHLIKGSVPGRDARAFPGACAPSSPRPPFPTRGEGGGWAS